MNSHKQYIILSYNKDEYIPIFLGFSHNLKEKNLVYCESSVIFKNESIVTLKKIGKLNEKDIVINFTLSNDNVKEEFLSGDIHVNDKKYPISGVYTYSGLQIGKWCYDNICLVKINDESFEL